MMRRFLRGAMMTVLAALLVLSPAFGEAAAKGLRQLVVFHTNDMHGRMMTEDDSGKSIGLAEL